jgi:TFIIF-interacting CTD phosphatase-like protein
MTASLFLESSSVFRDDYELCQTFPRCLSPHSIPNRKITVIIGLDQVLIHASPVSRPYSDFLVTVSNGTGSVTYSVYLRPFAREFLSALATLATVYLFTTADSEYTEKVLRHIDPVKRVFAGVFTRKDCIYVNGLQLAKRFENCGIDMNRTVIIGHTVDEFGEFTEQGLLVRPYTGEEDDMELLSILYSISAVCDNIP